MKRSKLFLLIKYNTGNIRITVTFGCFTITIVALQKQQLLHNLSVCL